MAELCDKCSNPLDDGVCKTCNGEVDHIPENDEVDESALVSQPIEKKSKKPFFIVLILVLGFLIAITIMQLSSSSYKGPINNYIEAVSSNDMDSLKKALLKEDYFLNKNAYIVNFNNYVKDKVGEDYKVSYKVIDKTALNDDRLDEFEDYYLEEYDKKISVKKGYDVSTVMIVKGNGKTYEFYFDLFSIKTKDGWKIQTREYWTK